MATKSLSVDSTFVSQVLLKFMRTTESISSGSQQSSALAAVAMVFSLPRNGRGYPRARLACLAVVAIVSSLPLTALADPCPDAVVSYSAGADGGFGADLLPGIVLGLPRGTGEVAASTDVVSLGDGGQIVLAFEDNAIVNGPGPDLRIFENPFRNGPTLLFREAGFVDLSPDGLSWTRLPWQAAGFVGLAGVNPVFSNPQNGIDPRSAAAGGDVFDLADIGLSEARFVRIVDPGAAVADPGNSFPIRGAGKSGFDLDAMVGIHSAETCGGCCDTVFDDALHADDLVTLLRVASGAGASEVCGVAPCTASHCGDTDLDGGVDRADVELCLGRALGHDVACTSGECDLDGRLAATAAAPIVAGLIEIPQPLSIQSGIGLVSGWRCSAGRMTAVFDEGTPIEVAYGTTREDTRTTCGDANNAFALQWNYNLLGDGPHRLRLFDEGREFSRVDFQVVTLGAPFRRDLAGSLALRDHPAVGDWLALDWQTASQGFGISAFAAAGSGASLVGAADPSSAPLASAGSAPRSKRLSRATAPSGSSPGSALEIPQAGSVQSGIGLVSGWRCTGDVLTASFDGGAPIELAYGTTREDTRPVCGDADNAFVLLWNYALLGDGEHRVQLFDDGSEFADISFFVVTLGRPFWRDLSASFDLVDFPTAGDALTLAWQTARQSFVIESFTPAAPLPTPSAAPSPSPTPLPSPTPRPSPTSGIGPQPTASPSGTPTPGACTRVTLHVRLVAATALAGALVRIDYPGALTLPWQENLAAVRDRVKAGNAVGTAFFGIGGAAGSLRLGAVAENATLGTGEFASVVLDCAGPLPAPAALICTVDAADANGDATGASCQLTLSP